ncbi:hypothetical protein PMI12_00234 [Variovorax sp. CF313]|uniref:hypothetical protein n=1 Tax=Variovorax sp. CF313 TaxID=1144315 RepID=UPI0002711FD5|nr:hypothetical protein [Variovorax sp. CF313]EJL80129.1 hypothetical protein PMI12_00234 [Variovorax sp. CF313]
MTFAFEWVNLADGAADVESLVMKGDRLYPLYRRKDPIKVALKDFKRTPTPVHRVIEVNSPERLQARAAEPEHLRF